MFGLPTPPSRGARRSRFIGLEPAAVANRHRRRYGALTAMLLAGGLVVSTIMPAGALEAPSDGMSEPAVASAAQTLPSTEPSTEPSTPVSEAPIPADEVAPPVPPSETQTPAPELTTPAEQPTPPATDPATDPTTDPAPAPDETPPPATETTLPGVVAPMSEGSRIKLASCGTGNGCGFIDVNVAVTGGAASVSNWTVEAIDTTSEDYYAIAANSSAQSVIRPASYQLKITPVNAALAAPYTMTLACETGRYVTFDAASAQLRFDAPASNNSVSRRTAQCDYTFVAPPAPTSASVTAYVGGDRTGLNGITALSGATLRLWAGDSSGPTAAFTTAWSSCVSDATGACVFTVPNTNVAMTGAETDTTGGNQGRRFWVVQEVAPAGWIINTHIATGASGATKTAYVARTNPMSGTTAQNSRVDFMIGTGDTSSGASGGTFVMVRDNRTVQQACGANVALLVDLSGSMSGALADVKDAAKAMVGALEGTDSTMGIYTFASTAPAPAGTMPQTTVSTAAGADSLRSFINGFSATGATNWDRGLSQIPTGTYDAVIVITDGNPTFYGNEEGPGDFTRFREVENGVFSANELKAAGTRVIALGVGAGISGPSNNLAAISGPTLGSDYFQTADFTGVKSIIRDFALGNCLGSLTVVKQVVPRANTGGNTTGAAPASGWTFNGTSQTSGLTLGASSVVTAPVTGAANFPLTYSGGVSTGTVRVNEIEQSGYGIYTQGGKNAVCTATDLSGTTTNVAVANQTVGGQPGFDVAVPRNVSVSCVVYNQPKLIKTSITVDKQWRINDTSYSNSDNPLAVSGATASLTLAGTAQAWATPRTGLDENASVSIDETMPALPASLPQCSVSGVQVLGADGAVVATSLPYSATLDANAAANSYTIVNIVDCGAQLTLKKSVQNGSALAPEWTLTAYGPDASLVGPSGQTGTVGLVTPGERYELGESGPLNYRQTVAPSATITAPATGSWTCVQTNAQGVVLPGFSDGLNGGVRVPLGANVECTAVNQTSFMVLVKQVINDDGGTAEVDDFSLSAAASPALPGAMPTVVAGASFASATPFEVRPNHVYTLTESSLAGYAMVTLQQRIGSSWVDVVANPDPAQYPQQDADGNWQVTVAPLATNTYRFVNDDVAPTLTLMKKVVNAYGSDAAASDWTLSASSDDGALIGTSGVTTSVVAGREYLLSESGGPNGFTNTALSCSNRQGSLLDPTVILSAGESVTCTFTNTAQPARVKLTKAVDNSNGATAKPGDWDQSLWIMVNGEKTLFDSGETIAVAAATYEVGEDSAVNGYALSALSCDGVNKLSDRTITTVNGGLIECTITNKAAAPTITLIKVLDESNYGGDADPSAWMLSATTPGGQNVSGSTGVTGAAQAGVTYSLSESAGVNGYQLTSLSCTGISGVSHQNPTFTLEPGQETTCVFTNTSLPAHLTLVKEVKNLHGGTAVGGDWNQLLQATMGTSDVRFDHAQTQTVPVGTYDLAERAGGPAGYEQTGLTCTAGFDADDATVTLANGQNITCTFTNTDKPPHITLVKVVDTHQWGGAADPAAWTLSARALNAPLIEGATGTTGPATAGLEYTLYEDDAIDGFELIALSCTGLPQVTLDSPRFTLGLDQHTTCTFTNSSQPARLTLKKSVDNSHGGQAVRADWDQLLTATNGDDVHAFDEGATKELTPGTYTLNELDGPAGYKWTDLRCWPDNADDDASTGEVDLSNPQINLLAGEAWTCQFTNESQRPRLTLEKQVDNLPGGLRTADEWTLTASTSDSTLFSGTGTMRGIDVASLSGLAVAEVPISLGEMGPSGYIAGQWACHETGTEMPVTIGETGLVLAVGDDVTCRILNQAIPATGSVSKTVTSTTQNDDGTWTIVYDITVTNQSTTTRYSYSLSDELNYGGGIEILDATWSGPGATDAAFAADGTAVMATDATINPPLATTTYTVTVNANVTAQAYADDGDVCHPEGAEAGGFLNTVLLTDSEGESTSLACSEPIKPQVDKSTQTIVDDGHGTWTLSYLLSAVAPDGDDSATVVYDLADTLTLPEGVEMVGNAVATAQGATPAPTNATFDGTGTWLIVDDGRVGADAHVYLVTVTLAVTAEAVDSERVCEYDGDGISVGNSALLISGEFEDEGGVCDVVHYDDVSLEKTAGLGERDSVQPGDTFDYVLTVTNNGSRAATDVLVEDTSINDRLAILAMTVTPGYTWSFAPGYDTHDVALFIDSIEPGESVEIRVTVEFLPPELPEVELADPIAQAPTPLDELTNTACVIVEHDNNAENNCDEVEIWTRDITAIVSTACVGDAPYLIWTLKKSETLRDDAATMVWTPTMTGDHVPTSVTQSQPGGSLTWSGSLPWPGAQFTPSGVSIDHPGWRALQARDYAPGGGYFVAGTTTVMTPDQQAVMVVNGQILDASELDYAWRLDTTVTFSVNPEISFTATYPSAQPDCAVARHSDVQIEKTASVDRVKAGDSLTYTITTANMSDDSAADNVVITDVIPAHLRITDVTWEGEGEASVFPNWETCEITGASSTGYGGTLTCTLFGVVQYAGHPEGASTAPTLTLTAIVAATAPVGNITNVAVVTSNTFDDPTDTTRDEDEAIITVWAAGGATPPALPATGATVHPLWVMAATLAMAGALVLLVGGRRRRKAHSEL